MWIPLIFQKFFIDDMNPNALPTDVQNELDALQHLSTDALWTMAREQLPDEVQARASALMALDDSSEAEQAELAEFVERADRLMLWKAEAASLLQSRGIPFTRDDFKLRYR